jgi:hypothetical protein
VGIDRDSWAASLEAAARIVPGADRARVLAVADVIHGVAEAARMWERVGRMELVLQRGVSANGCTIGELRVDGAFECYVLEDVVREIPGQPVEAWKIFGVTAIPAGRYRVKVSYSPHFQRRLPELVNVPGYVGVRIHAGNSAKDTEGCLVLGQARTADSVQGSVAACQALLPRLEAACDGGGEVWITVLNAVGAVS